MEYWSDNGNGTSGLYGLTMDMDWWLDSGHGAVWNGAHRRPPAPSVPAGPPLMPDSVPIMGDHSE